MNLMKRAIAYRAGSIVLGIIVFLILTGDPHKSLLWESIFFFTHTTYYMAFHWVERRVRSPEEWNEAIEEAHASPEEVIKEAQDAS